MPLSDQSCTSSDAPSTRWGVGLSGHEIDLKLWAETLKRPFDPWVEEQTGDREHFVLFSSQFEAATSYEEVRQLAAPLVGALNGAMTLARGAEELKISAVLDFSRSPPTRHVSITAQGAVFRVYSSMPTLTAYRADGSIIPPPPPVPSKPQIWIDGSRDQEAIGDLLVYASRADNWFDLYKLIEATAELAKGEHRLEAMSPGIKAAKTSANFHRHHRAYRPEPLLDFSEVRGRAFAAARIVLERFGR